MGKIENYNKLKKLALANGAVLFGVAEVSKIKSTIYMDKDIIKKLPYAITMAVKVSGVVLEEIVDHPTKLYFHHYRALNQMLDQIALIVASKIESDGYSALPIPASQIIDWEKQFGMASHREIAYLGGLGWIGRNNLLVTEKFGSRIRLVTVFTDIPLKVDKPSGKGCGGCRICIETCPSGSIKENKEDFDYMKCFEKLKDFRARRFTDQFICGVCVKACRGKLIKK